MKYWQIKYKLKLSKDIFYLPYFKKIAEFHNPKELCFIDGGWVRDKIINHYSKYNVIDIDFLTTSNSVEIGRKFAKWVNGSYKVQTINKNFFHLRPFLNVTVIWANSLHKYKFDFRPLSPKSKNIEKSLIAHLKKRDFTVNALAVNINDILNLSSKKVIIFDPTGGINDLKLGILKPISLKKFGIREVLRGYRISIENNFKLSKDFLEFSRKKKARRISSSIELIIEELLRIIHSPKKTEILEELNRIGILNYLLNSSGIKNVNKDILNGLKEK